jgi:hypothetical protein
MTTNYNKRVVFQGTINEIFRDVLQIYPDVPIFIDQLNNIINKSFSFYSYMYYKNENTWEDPQYIFDIHQNQNGDVIFLNGSNPDDTSFHLSEGVFKKNQIYKLKIFTDTKTIIKII